jgi:uncharacterized membrane protein
MSYSTEPYQQQPAPAAQQRYNVLSIVGFVLAFFISIAGLVVSIIALVQIKRTGERGRGLALAGVIISAIAIIISVISFIALFAVAANSGYSSGY